MRHPYDLILVGGGLANGLIALRLRQTRPDLRIIVLEQNTRPAGNHTWSFHQSDLTDTQLQWITPLISKRWPGYQVHFPQLSRILNGGYASIFSSQFAQIMTETLGDALRVNAPVEALSPTEVQLKDGTRIHAQAVIDGRGLQPTPHLALGWQAFLGLELELDEPHGLQIPVVMDATVAQGSGYRFVYVLPFSPTRLLIEDTHYVDRPTVVQSDLRQNIAAYAATRGWKIREQIREESGVLPITLAGDFNSFWREAAGQPRSGLRAGLFHPTTGYSLPHAVRLAELIAGLEDFRAPALYTEIYREARCAWLSQRFFRLLNRMLFLSGRPEHRWRVLQRFYGLPEGLIQRFYAGQLNFTDKLRIVTGKPPVPLGQAFRAARLINPQRIRTTL